MRSLANSKTASHSSFINPRLTRFTLDTYIIRKGIFDALRSSVGIMAGAVLDVGAGNQPYREFVLARKNVSSYTALDLADNGAYARGEVLWDGVRMPFKECYFDTAMATEVLEHCPEPLITLGEIHRVLKPSGVFFLTVPFLWPLHDAPNDEFRYTPWSLERLLLQAGFTDIKLWPTGGWNAALVQSIGLYTRRAPMNERLRGVLSLVCLPLIWLLAKTDKPLKQFNHGFYLMPGIAGTARTRAAD